MSGEVGHEGDWYFEDKPRGISAELKREMAERIRESGDRMLWLPLDESHDLPALSDD